MTDNEIAEDFQHLQNECARLGGTANGSAKHQDIVSRASLAYTRLLDFLPLEKPARHSYISALVFQNVKNEKSRTDAQRRLKRALLQTNGSYEGRSSRENYRRRDEARRLANIVIMALNTFVTV